MKLSDLENIRVEKLNTLRQQGIEPYPTRNSVSHQIIEVVNSFTTFEKENPEKEFSITFTIGGRIRSIRAMGKLAFCHIEDGSGRIQIMLRINEVGKEKLDQFKDLYDLGDFIQVNGTVMRSRTGEITLLVSDFQMLAKAISPLPAAKDVDEDGKIISHATLTDPETRYRQRYADLAVKKEVRDIFLLRFATIRALQDFLDNHGFIEVETPILQPIYGGAAAQPFKTHHNQLHQDLFLRISFELYLKRLLVGGLDRVYEIGRDFRNEGVSFKHNPEFTQLEFYWAYADYLKVMKLTEEMISQTAKKVLGTQIIHFNGHEINLTPPWKRVDLRQGIIDAAGIDISDYPDTDSLAVVMDKKGFNPKPGAPRGKLIDALIGDILEPSFIQPTFLFNYPREISPLAKTKPGNPSIVERFEGFVGGMELCNAFTELNDPLEQEKRFLEMGRAYKADDEERHPMDNDYLKAMSYGMPPSGGFGMGIDRLVMLLANKRSIREVILFPHLRETEE
ncbi:MAG: lysine--tRNA ligase [Anaerolineaceae bacterium]|nr:lysine--tRNA ligase [Anaerolineaceae bacterium]